MTLRRRQFLQLAAGAAALPRTAMAQSYPARPVTLIVFVPAGGTPDIIARLIGQSMSQRLGQSVASTIGRAAAAIWRSRRSHARRTMATRCSWSRRRTPST